jgi:methoxymalonate biosynthesis acyl carrier protein
MERRPVMQIEQEVSKYVLELCNEPQLDSSLNLFEHGYLSSLDILDLISFIEETFEITIADDDLNIENFGSIASMVSFIARAKQES